MDQDDMLRYLSAPETIHGEVLGVDLAGKKLYLQTGGGSLDERQTLRGALNIMTLYINDETNLASLKSLNKGDQIAVSVREETTKDQPFGTGNKLVKEVYVVKGSQLLGGADNPGFGGGLGQRPDPLNAASIPALGGSYTGVPAGSVQPGAVDTGITSEVGVVTGAAPCWQCAPQPDTVNARTDKTLGTDYGDDRKNFNKGTVQ